MRTSHSLKSSRNQNKCSLLSILGGKELAILRGTKKLVAFYTEREREDRALRRKMLIASKKRLLAVHENQRDEIVKNIVYKTPVPSLDELKPRIVTAIQNVIPQMLENTWREIEFRLYVLLATKGSHVQVH
ncbi:hypothetical protein AVEN_69886-1 [Araneus ventricosus]|uniref:Uncharacterized protein n=3 Tax=Araneus ventricosus TaxID=182803 RepID=A0A4Y2T4B6_ARAVE|nr:hypothetical protein AVEN_266768-1 [Araneus ventricosus]GBN95397.1 hypothetical protein AVEN_69886-1 [Araneus ventricosus]